MRLCRKAARTPHLLDVRRGAVGAERVEPSVDVVYSSGFACRRCMRRDRNHPCIMEAAARG
jgi:hypothetical protein